MDDEWDRLERAQRQLGEARAGHARKRRTLERMRSYAEEVGLSQEQLAKLAAADEDLDREGTLHEVQARELELEGLRLRRSESRGRRPREAPPLGG